MWYKIQQNFSHICCWYLTVSFASIFFSHKCENIPIVLFIIIFHIKYTSPFFVLLISVRCNGLQCVWLNLNFIHWLHSAWLFDITFLLYFIRVKNLERNKSIMEKIFQWKKNKNKKRERKESIISNSSSSSSSKRSK